MTEPPDELDTWLARDVEPLAPPPGTFERIQGRARRRKRSQALMASAAAVVVAGGVLIPAAATGLLTGGGHPAPPAAAARPRSSTPAPTTAPPSAAVSPSATVPPSTGLSVTTSGTAVPASFQPTSITMISGSVGAVIGQAGTPGHCGPPVADDCTSLAGTADYGSHWYGVSAPVTSAPDGSAGVSQLRFLNLSDGWAFGPALYTTADGGRNWTAESTFGLRVIALETAGDRAFVLLASCQGTGPAYAAGCSTFSLYSTVGGTTTLAPVQLNLPSSLPAGVMGTAGVAGSGSLVIKGDAARPGEGTAYLLAPSGDLLSGPVAGGAWTYAGRAPCAPGTAAATGAPLAAQLALGGSTLVLNCADRGGPPGQLWTSADGATWRQVSVTGGSGTARSLAATNTGAVVLATTAGLFYATLPGPGAWHSATVAGTPAGGFSYVGMTTPTQGVALPADAALGEVFITTDGGRSWAPSRVSG